MASTIGNSDRPRSVSEYSTFSGSVHSSNVEFSLEDVCRIESPVAHAGGDFKKL